MSSTPSPATFNVALATANLHAKLAELEHVDQLAAPFDVALAHFLSHAPPQCPATKDAEGDTWSTPGACAVALALFDLAMHEAQLDRSHAIRELARASEAMRVALLELAPPFRAAMQRHFPDAIARHVPVLEEHDHDLLCATPLAAYGDLAHLERMVTILAKRLTGLIGSPDLAEPPSVGRGPTEDYLLHRVEGRLRGGGWSRRDVALLINDGGDADIELRIERVRGRERARRKGDDAPGE